MTDYTPNGAVLGDSNRPLDTARCREGVTTYQGNWPRYSQCARKAGGDGYCHQHRPEAVAKRATAAAERHAKESRNFRVQTYAHVFRAALEKIRDGDNDPRGTARDVLERAGL